jgi:hypothetical protein
VEDSLREEGPQTPTPELEGPQTVADADPGPRGLVVWAVSMGFGEASVIEHSPEHAARVILGMLRNGVPRVSVERIDRTV